MKSGSWILLAEFSGGDVLDRCGENLVGAGAENMTRPITISTCRLKTWWEAMLNEPPINPRSTGRFVPFSEKAPMRCPTATHMIYREEHPVGYSTTDALPSIGIEHHVFQLSPMAGRPLIFLRRAIRSEHFYRAWLAAGRVLSSIIDPIKLLKRFHRRTATAPTLPSRNWNLQTTAFGFRLGTTLASDGSSAKACQTRQFRHAKLLQRQKIPACATPVSAFSTCRSRFWFHSLLASPFALPGKVALATISAKFFSTPTIAVKIGSGNERLASWAPSSSFWSNRPSNFHAISLTP